MPQPIDAISKGGGMTPLDVGVDLDRMRAERRARVVAAMAEEGIDALVLGTGANLRYATGATPLWLAGTRPFAPLAVVLADGRTHLVANSDDGIPEGIGLIPASWNPLTIMERLACVDGFAGASRIGVDGLSPMFEGLLTATFPDARLVDATTLLHRVRATKTDDELACMGIATALCEAALDAVASDLVGRTERELHGRFVEHMAASGTTIPAFDGTFCVVDEGRPLRRLVSDRTVVAGDRVALDAGVMVHGYEGGLARTEGADATAARAALDALKEACRPGVTADELARAAPNPDLVPAYGVGLGVEPLSTGVGATLCLQVLVDGVLLRETVVMGADGVEPLPR
jgi:Xaa-Pro aminopeptidase